MALQGTDIVDLVSSVINDKGRMKMTDLMSTRQHTIFWKQMTKKKGQMPYYTAGGTEFEFNLIRGTNNSARGVGLYYTANLTPTNVMTTGKMPWRHATAGYVFDHREVSMNAPDVNKIYDLVQTRRLAALGSWIEYTETRWWRCPATTNTDDFHGVPYWVPQSATATTTNDGFNGALPVSPSGYTTIANIDPTAATITPKWSAYTDTYTDISPEDFLTKLERASDKTDFMPLVDEVPQYADPSMGDYGYYCGRATRVSLKDVIKGQNEDLGFDLDPVGDRMQWRRVPITWVNELDSSTVGVFYGICWPVFSIRRLPGWWMKETIIKEHDAQPTVTAVHLNSSFNTCCVDRRRNFVLCTSVSELS